MDFIIPFIFESVFQVVTWVVIGLAIGGIWYYVGKDNLRAVLWSVVVLICAAVVMLAIVLQNHMAVFAAKTEPPAAQPPPAPSGPRACLAVKDAKIIEGTLQSAESGIVTAVNAERHTVVLKPGVIVTLEVAIENRGDATAKEVQPLWISGTSDAPMLPDKPDYQEGNLVDKVQSVFDLPKGGVTYVRSQPMQLTAEEVVAINEQKIFLSIYGYVTYRDTTERRMTYNYLYSPRTFSLGMGPNHNETDCESQND